MDRRGMIMGSGHREDDSESSEVVETWEDLIEDDEDAPNGAELSESETIKPNAENIQHENDLELATDLFGKVEEPQQATDNKDPNAQQIDAEPEIPAALQESLNAAVKVVNDAIVSGDCKLLEEVLSRLLSVSGKKPQEDILEKVSNLVAAVISSHKEYLSSTLQAKTDEKTQAKAAQVKSKSAVTGTNATTTQAKGLSATKKQYLNIGASKKKFNKYWLKEEIDMEDDEFDDGINQWD